MLKKLKSKFSSFLHNETVENTKTGIKCALLMTFCFGWVIVYDLFTVDSDWTETDNTLYYTWCMFLVIVFGTIVHAIFLFFAFLAIVAFIMACYYGWFVMLPLFLMFIGIYIGRWFYLKKHRKV